MKYSIVIPCYNEAENLKELVKKCKIFIDRDDTEVILVENGSKDNSKEVIKKIKMLDNKKFKVVYVPVNQGYGYGLQQGLKKATGDFVGWIHADMQISPNEMIKFMDYLEQIDIKEKVFIKALRKNRSIYDKFFTFNMSIFETILFHKKLNDIGAIPVLFDRKLLKNLNNVPYDFSIELYFLYQAVINKYKIYRLPVDYGIRENGTSSWNKGLKSKIKQSKIIISDSFKIKRGEQVK